MGLLIGGELRSREVAFSVVFLGTKTGASDSFTEELIKPISKTVTDIFERTQNKLLVKSLYRKKLLDMQSIVERKNYLFPLPF